MEKLSLDNDSPIRGDYKRDTDTNTSVRQTEREQIGEVCDDELCSTFQALLVKNYDGV